MSTRFSFILDPSVQLERRPENRLIAETHSFAVVPSLGSLVPGWLLVVPKRPLLNCGQLVDGERSELTALVGDLRKRLAVFPGRVFAFEHGSSEIGAASGCGVDQAHLHVVPLPFDLLEAAARGSDVCWRRSEGNTVGESVGDTPMGEYIAVHDCETNAAVVGQPERPTSQWVRRIIATGIGRSTEWNYREHEGQANIAATLGGLTPAA